MTNESQPGPNAQQSRIATAMARYGLMRKALEAARSVSDRSEGSAARLLNFLKSP